MPSLTDMYGHNLDYYNTMLRAEQKNYELYWTPEDEVWWRHRKDVKEVEKKKKVRRHR